MATAEIILSETEWTRITAAGESGACWKKTGGQVVIDHTILETADVLPLSNTNVTVGKSKRVPLDKDSDTVLEIAADTVSDVFYALAIGDATAKIVIDVI